MTTTLEFPDLLRLIDDRAAAFRAAVESAPGLAAKVPSCPEWTVSDLVRHLGQVHRFWAEAVAAGPADGPPAGNASQEAEDAPQDLAALLEWSAASTRRLLDALREAGPDRDCWTWWAGSQSPQTSGAVARHQVQEATVHTYDAQLAAGDPQPLPAEAALDGVDEFLVTCCAGPDAWPFEPVVVEYHATEGRSWHLDLSAEGTKVARVPAPNGAAATGTATAAELVLVFYGRLPIDALQIEGDRLHLERLRDWDEDA